MTNYEIWQDLRKQTKIARKGKEEKRNAITSCEWDSDEKSCIKVFQIQSLGIPNENLSDMEYSIKPCDDFYEGTVCNVNCKMHKQNKEYQEAVAVFQGLKRARRKAFWDMVFSRGK